VLVSLGNWQVRRLAWKEDLIARVAERPAQPPVDLNEGGGLDSIGEPGSFLERFEYRNAVIRGRYKPDGEVLSFTSLQEPRGKVGGVGYWVLTPFRPSSSNMLVYVNRGFVPEERKSDYAPPPAGEVTLRGLVRAPETGSWLTPEPNVEARVFYARDIGRIAGLTGQGRQAGFLLDLAAPETPPGGLPQAGETRMAFTNNHVQYAITWYGLAAALLAVFAAYVRSRLREGDKKPA
jgi:surfeit locus 1 family protein